MLLQALKQRHDQTRSRSYLTTMRRVLARGSCRSSAQRPHQWLAIKNHRELIHLPPCGKHRRLPEMLAVTLEAIVGTHRDCDLKCMRVVVAKQRDETSTPVR